MTQRERERERKMALPNLISTFLGLLWLTLNLALIIQGLSRYFHKILRTPVRCYRVPAKLL
jgi:hypothetical protein